MGRYANTKLGKTNFLTRHQEMNDYIPETRKASDQSIRDMLEHHRMVYVKPNVGTGGHGIVKAELDHSHDRPRYQFTYKSKTERFSTYEDFYKSLRKIIGRRTYIVQKGVRMLKYKKRPFDIRVMVQKNESGAWEHTGTIGRLAHPNRIVTNYHSGGTPLPLRKLLRRRLSSKELRMLEKQLASLSLQVASLMQDGYPKVKELGVDVGLDKERTPWIFEVNTRPDPFIFLKLGKPEVFQRIIRLTRLHGRFRGKRKR
jgi:glutathione synthase/RimK-type ligase-like ATP-grasp enzyme